MLSSLLTREITIVTRTASGTDDYGNALVTETTTVVLGELQQRRRTEPGDQAETSDEQWDLYLPATASLDTGDAIRVDGLEFEVVGAPWRARNPRTGTQSHIEATLRRVAGAEADT